MKTRLLELTPARRRVQRNPRSERLKSGTNLASLIGNQRTQDLVQKIAPGELQIGTADDAYELEAQRMAEQLLGGALRRSTMSGEAPPSAPAIVDEVLHSPGQPLDTKTRRFFEPRLGHDFSQVRVHTDAKAAESARAINANAYTKRQHIAFAAGQFSPDSAAGKQLLAHELIHVVQSGATPDATQANRLTLADEPAECEGNRFTAATKVGWPLQPSVVLDAKVARQPATPAIPGFSKAGPGNILSRPKDFTWTSLSSDEWHDLRQAAESSERPVVLAHIDALLLQFSYLVRSRGMTFETITEDQRVLFNLLFPADRESLRKEAILNSSLFKAITAMHISRAAAGFEAVSELSAAAPWRTPDVSEIEQATQRKFANQPAAITNYRMGSDKPGDWLFDASITASFALHGTHDLVANVLASAPTNPNLVTNRRLAQFIGNLRVNGTPEQLRERIVTHTWSLACGFGNLFALFVSRGKATATSEGARAWFEQWTLDAAEEQSILEVGSASLMLRLNPALKYLSSVAAAPVKTDIPVRFGQPNSESLFQSALQAAEGRSRAAGALETRVGIMQGKGAAGHMYLVFKDLDGVWRTMDMYLGLGDKPEGGAPYRSDYATESQWVKLVTDNPR